MQKRCKVLIADDSERARNGLRALLAMRQEIEIVGEAADGREAVQKAMELRPNVVLMDAQMPQVDGLEATRQIKARWPGVRVIVVTIYASHRAGAWAAGANGFLPKGGGRSRNCCRPSWATGPPRIRFTGRNGERMNR